MMLMLLSACQSESLIENIPPESLQPERKITVKATLPDEPASRAHIVYGYGEPGTECEEQFRWYKGEKGEKGEQIGTPDWITVCNVSKFAKYSKGVELEVIDIDNSTSTATFESVESVDADFKIEPGDTIVAFLGSIVDIRSNYGSNQNGRYIICYEVGTEANKPQYIEESPDTETALSYMNFNLKMYDIVIADKDGNLPDFHFKHLSTIFRVTLHNESGSDIYTTKLEINYPTTSPTAIDGDPIHREHSFFNTTLYCDIVPDLNGGCMLKIYDTKDFYKAEKDQPYTNEVGTTFNGKSGTTDIGGRIPDGSSYELYITAVPRIGNDSYGDEITISLTDEHHTNNPFELTLNGFNRVIEAGKRYWFNVTATPDNKLVLTSQYNSADYTKPSGN